MKAVRFACGDSSARSRCWGKDKVTVPGLGTFTCGGDEYEVFVSWEKEKCMMCALMDKPRARRCALNNPPPTPFKE